MRNSSSRVKLVPVRVGNKGKIRHKRSRPGIQNPLANTDARGKAMLPNCQSLQRRSGNRWQVLPLGSFCICIIPWLIGCASITTDSRPEWPIGSDYEAMRGADDETLPAQNEKGTQLTVSRTAENCVDPRSQVHVFVINGFDPFHYADVPGLADYIRGLGYEHVHYSELITAASLEEQIEQTKLRNPNARIVLIGYSFGANAARNLTHNLGEQGIPVDLLVYLNGNTLRNTPYDRPANAKRVVNVLAWGVLLDGAQLDNAENIEIPDAWHFNTPKHPVTLDLIQRELDALTR